MDEAFAGDEEVEAIYERLIMDELAGGPKTADQLECHGPEVQEHLDRMVTAGMIVQVGALYFAKADNPRPLVGQKGE